jgi:hypothetical protein
MSCTILTPERWELFLKNGLSKEETAELIVHLESACPDCDQFFSQIRKSTEHDLRHMFNNIPENELDFIKKDTSRQVTGESNPSGVSAGHVKTAKPSSPDISPKRGLLTVLLGGGPFSPGLAGGLAIFVLIAVGLLVQLQVEDVPMQTEKGISNVTASSLNLQFATGHKSNNEFIVERGVNGGQYTRDDTLYLHYKLPVKGYVYLIGYQAKGNVDVLYPHDPDRMNIQDIGEYSIPAGNATDEGISLNNINGRYLVIGIYSPDSLEMDKQLLPVVEQSVDSTTGSINQQKMESLGKDIVVDVVYFDVRA